MAESRNDILERMLDNIDDKYDKSTGSFIYDTQKPVAIELERLYSEIDSMVDRAFAATAHGSDLDMKVAEKGLTRIEATFSSGSVVISGTEGTEVPDGTQLLSDKILFTILEGGTIGSGGSITLTAHCEYPGVAGNVPAGAINAFAVAVAGLTSVTNPAAFTGGAERESDEQLRERYYTEVRRPVTSGNKYHYEQWAREASPDVGDAKCIPLWDDDTDHTSGEVAGAVTVLVLNRNMEPAGTTLVGVVEDYIAAQKPIGSTVYVDGATPLAINVSATLVVQSGFTVAQVTSAISSAITAYLKTLAFSSQNEVSVARIGSCILSVNGVLDHSSLTVNSGTSNIEIPEYKVPVLGVVTLV